MRSIGMERHRKGTEGLSSGTAQQRLSDDQLGRRMAMQRQWDAQPRAEGQGNSLASYGRGGAKMCYGRAKNGKGMDESRSAKAKYCKEELWH